MKKLSVFFGIIFMTFFCEIINVFADPTPNIAIDCNYGTMANGKWEQIVTFRVFGYDDLMMNPVNSTYWTVHGGELNLVPGKDCDNCNFMDENEIIFANDYYFYLALYANDTDYRAHIEKYRDYCVDNGLSFDSGDCTKKAYMACPKFVQVGWNRTIGYNPDREYYYFIYTDALTDESNPGWSWSTIYTRNLGIRDVLVLYEAREEEIPENLKWGNSCNTYDSYMSAMRTELERDKRCKDNVEFQNYYRALTQICENYRASTSYADGGEKVSGCMKACSKLRDDVTDLCGFEIDAPASDGSCYSLGSGVLGWIAKIMNMIRYALPVILILLGIMDFIKAIASEDDGEIKKAGTKFVKRLIAAALIFVVPLILQFVLGMFNLPGLNSSNPFCI